MKTALITGASSGIGEATARSLANLDYQLILCGRNSSALNSLKEELDVITSCICLCFDVRDADQVNKQISSLPESFNKIDVLINNAGNAHGLGKIQEGDISDWDAMMDINVKGLLYVSKSIIPGMVERNSGHIINIGSLAGKEVYANGTVYCASNTLWTQLPRVCAKIYTDIRLKWELFIRDWSKPISLQLGSKEIWIRRPLYTKVMMPFRLLILPKLLHLL
jgi:NADP-dependent 3-hydroxy acid dehydrogenase YdfG